MLLGGDVAEHRRAVPADHRSADAAGDMVIAGRDIGRQRSKRVEGGFAARLQLLVHILLDLVHRHMAGARSEEHTSELQSLMRISYAVFCLKKKKKNK